MLFSQVLNLDMISLHTLIRTTVTGKCYTATSLTEILLDSPEMFSVDEIQLKILSQC